MATKSRYVLIKGSFHIFYPDLPRQGPEPDGDTLTFKPDNPSLATKLKRFGSSPAKINKRGTVPVRFEGIDALETHFQGMHQDLKYANKARDTLLSAAGFKNVVFWDDQPNKVQSVKNNPQPGYVIANGIDSNGRLLGFVFAGSSKEKDGAAVFLDADRIDQSINIAVIKAGLAYAELYTSLPAELIKHMRQLAKKQRKKKDGMWPSEDLSTSKRATIADLDALEKMVMWPKLFRRLASYFAEGNEGLGQFDGWMRADQTNRDDRVMLPDGEFGNMHDIYSIDGNEMKLRYDSEELVILPDNA